MSSDHSAAARRPWGRYLFLVGLILLTGLGWHFGWRNLGKLIGGASWRHLALMTLLILAGFWIRAWKWHYALGRGQQGIRLFFIAKTAGNFTPGRAGELAPLLLRQHRNARVAAWIGLDRLVEVAWTLGLGFVGAAAIGLIPWWGAALGVAGGLLAVALSWLLLRKNWFRFDQEEESAKGSIWRIKAGRFVNTVRDELLLFAGKLPLIMTTTALAKATDIYAVILLCRAFGYDASFLLVGAARCAHALVSAVPVTPDATGVPFIAAAWCLNTYADIPYDTLTAALGLEVIVINAILWACFCGVSALRWRDSSHSLKTSD
ncbi:MAG: flippase-like domain-containing protein [Candidatus Hydrogenedentes bacterium]|nr:flippase-like domain-containing protein [Candidatus Hydrogenedentota bacterium]